MGKEVERGSSRVRYLGLLGNRGNGELRINVRSQSLLRLCLKIGLLRAAIDIVQASIFILVSPG